MSASEEQRDNTSLARQRLGLPATRDALIAQRRAGGSKTLNDYVEELHLELWEKPEYQALFVATHPADTKMGSIILEDGEAARLIQMLAAEKPGYQVVVDRKRAVVVKALNVVMRRYHIGRRERANMIGGVEIDVSRPFVNPQPH